MPRYVVLRHEMPSHECRASHWDLMLEQDDSLRTWALDREPVAAGEIAAEQLADHRLVYLEYEGPVSGNRGSVSRWDEGEYRVESETAEELVVTMWGRRLGGLLTLWRNRAECHSWRVSFRAVPTTG